ncbi:hypothetical protein FGO68_gene14572 [Halteria grandinella]|uniref:Uncharacterized protein n=1 Tax=Halteria grandinella TaxID=5974 RepID=A0A8J8P2F8_HALGN|nr:hypothetical protein FGO68_gene14572 [Halteria grandinella]
MDDPIVQEILSQHSKANPQKNKSIIYQRAIVKHTPLAQNETNIQQQQPPETRSLRHEEGLDIRSQANSRLSQKSKSIQSNIGNVRRAKLAIRETPGGRTAQLVNMENLKQFNEANGAEGTTVVKGTYEPVKVNSETKCDLCDTVQSDKDIRLSYRLANYARDQDGDRYKRLLYRVNTELEFKRRELEGNKSKDITEISLLDLRGREQDSHLPLICFKCIYELILSYEGRQNAMRFFNVAQSDIALQQKKNTQPLVDVPKNRNYSRLSNDPSKEMLDLSMMKGTFYDYQKGNPFTNYGAESTLKPQSDKNGYHALYFTKRNNKNKPFIISLARESDRKTLATAQHTREVSPNSLLNDSVRLPNVTSLDLLPSLLERSSTPDHIRRWREEYANKMVRQLAELSKQSEIQAAIERARDDEKTKQEVGYQLQAKNHELMKQFRYQTQLKDYKRRYANSEARKKKISKPISHYKFFKEAFADPSLINIVDQNNFQFGLPQKFEAPTTQTASYTAEVLLKGLLKPTDRTFFRKQTSIGAYANACFNAGVYPNPPTEAL